MIHFPLKKQTFSSVHYPSATTTRRKGYFLDMMHNTGGFFFIIIFFFLCLNVYKNQQTKKKL